MVAGSVLPQERTDQQVAGPSNVLIVQHARVDVGMHVRSANEVKLHFKGVIAQHESMDIRCRSLVKDYGETSYFVYRATTLR